MHDKYGIFPHPVNALPTLHGALPDKVEEDTKKKLRILPHHVQDHNETLQFSLGGEPVNVTG